MKTHNVLYVAALIGALSASAMAEDSDRDMRTRDRQTYEVIVGDFYTGRSPYFKGSGVPAPAPVQVAKTAPAPAPMPPPAPRPAPSNVKCSTITGGLVQMSKTMPAEAVLGENFTYELKPMASACAGNVVVTDEIPAGATLVGTEPQASVQGNKLVWNLGNMDAGESKTLKVTLRPDREGTLFGCATVASDPRVCGQTVVGKPALAITKTGPATAQLGADLSYNVTVSNTGTSVAKGVVIEDTIPAGLGGGTKSFQVGDLAPGASKTVTVPAKAAERGRHCNVAVATATNTGKVQADACTTIVKPGLKLTKTGETDKFINKQAAYKIVAQNIGDTELTGVVVTDNAPAGTRIVSAPGSSVSGNVATWNVGSLKPGETKSFDVVLTSPTAGRTCNVATINTAQGLRESSEACTLWRGISAVLLEVVDDPDPLQVGEQTVYTIVITNQGNADLTNINTVAQFQREVTPVSSQGGTVDGKTVRFPTVPKLGAKQKVTYTITGKAAEIGDHRLVVTLTEDQLLSPVKEEESTRVY